MFDVPIYFFMCILLCMLLLDLIFYRSVHCALVVVFRNNQLRLNEFIYTYYQTGMCNIIKKCVSASLLLHTYSSELCGNKLFPVFFLYVLFRFHYQYSKQNKKLQENKTHFQCGCISYIPSKSTCRNVINREELFVTRLQRIIFEQNRVYLVKDKFILNTCLNCRLSSVQVLCVFYLLLSTWGLR